MSKKRFERWNDCSCKVKDNQEYKLLDWEDVVNKLNKQQDTIGEQKIAIDELITDYKKLEKENEQLRQFINKGRRLSVKELMANTNENELLKKKIKELEKENKELQKYKNKRGVDKMSVKRFERWNDCSCKVKDNQEGILLRWEDVVKKLNEQQSTIERLEGKLELKTEEVEYLNQMMEKWGMVKDE